MDIEILAELQKISGYIEFLVIVNGLFFALLLVDLFSRAWVKNV